MTGSNETFKVEFRKTGKHWSRKVRRERMVPAVIYGPKMENQNVLVDERFIEKHRSPRFESTIFKTQADDSKISNINVLLKKIQWHPVSNRPVHVDFYALDMTQTVRVKVTINYEGEPVGVKEEGGVRNTILHDLEVECNPTEIPENITVDISNLALNSSIHASDITLPAGLKLVTAPERTLVTVAQPKEEKEPEVAADAAAEGAPAEGAAPAAEGAKEEDKK